MKSKDSTLVHQDDNLDLYFLRRRAENGEVAMVISTQMLNCSINDRTWCSAYICLLVALGAWLIIDGPSLPPPSPSPNAPMHARRQMRTNIRPSTRSICNAMQYACRYTTRTSSVAHHSEHQPRLPVSHVPTNDGEGNTTAAAHAGTSGNNHRLFASHRDPAQYIVPLFTHAMACSCSLQ